jgi:membrane protein
MVLAHRQIRREMTMTTRDIDTTSSRISWALVLGAIWASVAWAFKQLRARHDETRMPWSVNPPVALSAEQRAGDHDVAFTPSLRDQSAPSAARHGTRQEAAAAGSTLSQLKAEFSRYSPKELAKKIAGKFSDDEITTLSTAFAYHWVFALPPLLILIVMIASLLNTFTSVPVVENLREIIIERAPADSRQLLLDLVDNAVAQVGGNVARLSAIATGLVALWAASNAVGILIKGFNRAYNVTEERSFIHKKLVTIGLTLALVLFVNLALALLVFGEQLGRWIADQFGLGSVFDTIWALARWPIAISGIMLLLAVLYWKGPNIDQPFRWVSLGSAVATVLWLALVAGFGLYLSIANPGSTWGVVGSVIVLLLFLNFSGIIFFIGAEISGILHRALHDDAETDRGDA